MQSSCLEISFLDVKESFKRHFVCRLLFVTDISGNTFKKLSCSELKLLPLYLNIIKGRFFSDIAKIL